jgi:hypothetical protein
MVRLAQTVHVSCPNTATVTKWIKTRFHMTKVTLEIHRVHPKLFLSLWYIRCKPCTYLASRLALSPNRPKRASTRASSPRSTIGCVKTISEPMVRSMQTMHLSYVKISTISKRTEMSIHLSLVSLGYHRVRPKLFLSLWYIWRKPCTYQD